VFSFSIAFGESGSYIRCIGVCANATGLAEFAGGCGSRTRGRPKHLMRKSKSWKQG